jgi:cytidine deaminase
MPVPSTQEMIAQAVAAVRRLEAKDFCAGQVSAVIVTAKGNVYSGVCIDTGSSMGFCAEHNAAGSMITNGETHIVKVVAVWTDDNGCSYVVSPCGRCREFMATLNEKNLDAEVVLSPSKSATLRELIPHYKSYIRVDE